MKNKNLIFPFVLLIVVFISLLNFYFTVNAQTINETSLDTLQQKLQSLSQNLQKAINNICPPNSYLKNGLCYCNDGLVWNKDKTKCITYDEDCSSLYGSHSIAGKGDTKNKYLCYCEEGYVWNTNKTKCITPKEWSFPYTIMMNI